MQKVHQAFDARAFGALNAKVFDQALGSKVQRDQMQKAMQKSNASGRNPCIKCLCIKCLIKCLVHLLHLMPLHELPLNLMSDAPNAFEPNAWCTLWTTLPNQQCWLDQHRNHLVMRQRRRKASSFKANHSLCLRDWVRPRYNVVSEIIRVFQGWDEKDESRREKARTVPHTYIGRFESEDWPSGFHHLIYSTPVMHGDQSRFIFPSNTI